MKVRILLACTVAAITSCAAPENGQVVAKHYEPPYDWVQLMCSAYGKNGICTVQVPIVQHEPEHWVLTLRNGEDEGDRSVYRAAFERCPVGSTYPACAEAPQ